MTKELTLEFVNENFYEHEGKVCRKDGKKCTNSLNTKGYFRFYFNKKEYSVHRILWILRNQQEIDLLYFIDHADGNRSNNSQENLRLATRSQNCYNSKISKNNSSGYKGIHIATIKETKYYIATINKNYKAYNKRFDYNDLGLEYAKDWLEEKRKELHKDFANNG